MHPHQQTIESIYDAFAQLDPDGSAACHADTVAFHDQVLSLRGQREAVMQGEPK